MSTAHRPMLVVGAGFAGSVHARSLADAGMRVVVVERRPHIAGNAFDHVSGDGVRVHRYGPHLFHTANRTVLDWVKRFGEWVPYTHRVRGLLPTGALVPMPINLDTINLVFGTALATEDAARRHLARIAVPIERPANAAEFLAAKIGIELRDLFFRPYTRKMWDMELEDLDAGVVKRLPLRFDRTDTYFPANETQIMPRDGYTDFVSRVLDHPLIEVHVGTAFDPAMLRDARHCFTSMAIDEFYDYEFGPLPYRSIRFHHRSDPNPASEGVWRDHCGSTFSVVNFTDDKPFTRETAWHRMPHHIARATGRVTITREEPCDYRDNCLERYYPVRTADGVNEASYERYRQRAADDAASVTFIGRCGTYRYLDMDQVINQSLTSVGRWLRHHDLAPAE